MINEFIRLDFVHGREPIFNWYKTAKAEAGDLDALLKVECETDAIAFMDAYSPLFPYGMLSRAKLPSEFEQDKLQKMVFDVLNTVDLMKFAIKTDRLIANRASKQQIENNGYSLRFLKGGVRDVPQEYFFLDEYEDGCFEAGRCAASFALDLAVCADKTNPVNFEGLQDGITQQFVAEFDYYYPIVFHGLSRIDGETDECYRSALLSINDHLFSYELKGISIEPKEMKHAYSANDYSSFLWYTLFERLTAGEIRTCKACGKLFVANLGGANERGDSPKECCDANCRKLRSRGKQAREFMKDGFDMKTAAKMAKISATKLEKYLELNPIEDGVEIG